MISRVLEQEKALHQVLSVDRKIAHLVPTWQDLEVLESINKSTGSTGRLHGYIVCGEICHIFSTDSSSETCNR